ncbi:type II toxin-antitoxin system HicB family antitoxin [Myxococcota bacterium]|nr:type II toxin-antitoxin system HicB family antitoxin [Myxococcota bacterium]MBU1380182.1 type II toxin-antitoxin system HicB family antitoxin [Myxococcota bacterium]MBU1497332.1 type II toxin-antitoxin system HicB family antitoxin [Myxococcota bacterium]
MESKHYRIVIKFDAEKQKFIGNVPELDGCIAEGDSYEEVAGLLDTSINSILEKWDNAPEPIDTTDFINKISIEISSALYRDLVFLAKNDEVEPEVIAAEILSEGISRRCGYLRSWRNSQNQGGRRNGNREQRKGNMSREQYNNIMEDKAHFLEYVRNLEQPSRGGKPRKQRTPQED